MSRSLNLPERLDYNAETEQLCGPEGGVAIMSLALWTWQREPIGREITSRYNAHPALVADRDAAAEKEALRFADAVRDLIIDRIRADIPGVERHPEIDGAGCDSGDVLDVVLSEIHQGMNYYTEHISVLVQDRDRLRDVLGRAMKLLDQATCNCGNDNLTRKALVSEVDDMMRKAVKGGA